MLRKMFTHEDKRGSRKPIEQRSRNPMPANWKPPTRVPYHQARRPEQGIPEGNPADVNRPASPQSAPPVDSGE